MSKHAGAGSVSDPSLIAAPSFAERARTLIYTARMGSLSTLSRKQAGFPFGSLMPYGVDQQGRPLFLISSMAMHTHNLKADARASLLVTHPLSDGDPLGAARVTVLGSALPVPPPEVAGVRKLYLELHPNSRHWVDFDDFSFFRMDVVDLYYVGGFGVMGWVSASEYSQASPDPLAEAASAIMGHMNADHEDALLLLSRICSGMAVQEAKMTAVDRLGFDVRVKMEDGVRGIRIPFSRPVNSAAETRQMLVSMVQEARQK
ncbi:MAG TPA: DUF2470 domain-containing protein [Acidobacteriaceae bacterium]|nr:DUF2470 domain-containing protein [Acidobacteriaceae bacterium]